MAIINDKENKELLYFEDHGIMEGYPMVIYTSKDIGARQFVGDIWISDYRKVYEFYWNNLVTDRITKLVFNFDEEEELVNFLAFVRQFHYIEMNKNNKNKNEGE